MARSLVVRVGLALTALVLAACETTTPPSAPPAGSASPSAIASPSAAESPAESAAATPAPPVAGGRLAAVQGRGQLVCGVNGGLPGFSVLDEGSGQFSGFDVDFCRAIAAAALGDADAVEFRPLTADQRGPALQAGEIDVLIRNTTWTVTRDTTWGLFAPTTFYDGQGMMVTAETGAQRLEDLGGATICVQSGTTTELNLTDQMRALGVQFEPLVFSEIDATYQAYEQGRCDAVTSDRSQLVARRTTFANPDDHVILDVVMSKEPLGPVAPLGDDQWFNVVKWTVFATIEAEELGLTSANVQQEASASQNPVVRRLLGAEGELGATLGLSNDWVVDVISAVGNYGEIYDRNLGPDTPFALDRGLNQLWTDGGLLYAPPYR
ncbi:MAG TPA: amino acid ABC transporter substrate-binding protein [Candidatus Limnocylindrales bacterium]|nr:amino acid ABC transporter substrate-binding protein [Candidatus Limnocylindrales bacterium]